MASDDWFGSKERVLLIGKWRGRFRDTTKKLQFREGI
jgi:hypothetical protein